MLADQAQRAPEAFESDRANRRAYRGYLGVVRHALAAPARTSGCTMTGSSDGDLRDKRRVPQAATTRAAITTRKPLNSHWVATLSAGAAANSVIQVLAKMWKSWTSSRLPRVLLTIQLTTIAPATDPIPNTGRPVPAWSGR